MKTYNNPAKNTWAAITQRPAKEANTLGATVKAVFEDIKENGDQALKNYTEKFDGVILSDLKVSQQEIDNAIPLVSQELKDAIVLAKNNVEKFHAFQKIEKKVISTVNGVDCWQEMKPIEKVGLYIPGGSAPLFSTILMLGVPAKIAGATKIVLCTPPSKDGTINPAILFAAQLVGVTEIYKLGGIQAIAAMTYGTESVPSVYKIFGPGNQFVTAAKQYALTQGLAIDMPAGPSEVMVVADKDADASFVVADLLSQAEHGADSQVILVTESQKLIDEVQIELEKQLAELPRQEVARLAIENSSAILIDSIDAQNELINEYAPEHLILNVLNEDVYLDKIVNAGSVFIGPLTPESAGDYASGTNHTLPTNGYARMYSGVNLDAFTKKITYQKITAEGIQNIGPAIELMAAAEGLDAHKNAVTLRLNSLKK
ncbi:histidinol dehydrogenase [Wenyingzhuangia marina]|uniref:Histidinol dehydrogenase n=1 Tax=Wenyingzhuangia marina TaxID=1195760 RepID=A0A1M5V0W0_9FLAO|nr:histidinol dehydrogenase [Wenyingzhuangia marina]GGF75122.1 histidinol dehydrogenase [Wenyingzhuangia marina]SHH68937.1 histidinol dehydrogenase [Wenyingzhuangia marina]